MGFLDRVKRAVTGPVDIDVTAPATFAWQDGTLPVSARLTNGSDGPLVVAEVRFALETPPPRGKDGPRTKTKTTVSGPFTLAPGETAERRTTIPLLFDLSASTMAAAATEAGLPGWTGKAAKKVVGEPPRRPGPHKVSVTVVLEGSPRLSSSSTTITAT